MTDNADVWPDWPTFGLIDNIRPALAEARGRGVPVAIVTLFDSDGGSPRGLGAQMVVGDDVLTGHVSGGCIEGDIAAHCHRAIASGKATRLVYGRGGPWDLPLPCGGRIEVLIEPVPIDDPAVDQLLGFTDRRQPCRWLSDGQRRSCTAVESVARGAEAGRDGDRVFRDYVPRTRVIVVGSDPTAMAIAELSAKMDMESIIVRPQGSRTPPPLTNVQYSVLSPREALTTIGIDRWTAVAACAHDAAIDGETLLTALSSPAFFVGALGSARRRVERIKALRAAGVLERDVARLRTPIGLAIGARAPYEIAIATLAEIVEVSRGQCAQQSRQAA